ncbi:MAG: VCBS repeat-containing protein [Pirellulaceae bacterium]
MGDYDSDGFPDVYVACYGANVLYHNQGDGSFIRREIEAGVAETSWATGAGFFDADNDGDLDLYVCNYGLWSLETNGYCHADGNRAVRLFCSPKSIEPANDVYFENQGDGTFADRSQAAGFQQRAGRGQGVVMADLDGDHYVDVYLGNDLNANSLFMNNRDGTFRDETELSGVAYSAAGVPQAGMGVDAGDTNGDGRMELIVTNFKGEYSTLYENRGPGLFLDVSLKRGIGRDTIPYVSWGTSFADFDLDGWLDLLIVNGHVDPNRADAGEDAPYHNPALLWRNDSQGGTKGSFTSVHGAAGDFFQEMHSSRGLVVADLDNDGDFDFVSGNQDEPPVLVENIHPRHDAPENDEQEAEPRRSVTLKLVGTSANRDAIGSEVGMELDGHKFIDQITGGGSYLSNNDYRMILSVGTSSTATDGTETQGTVSQGTVRFNGTSTPWLSLGNLAPDGEYVVVEAHDPNQPPTAWRIDDVD